MQGTSLRKNLELSQKFSPHRAENLIGEHTDYNEGFVLPTPLSLCVYAAVRRRSDDLFNVYAFDLDEETGFKLENIVYDSKKPWSNYIKGVINSLHDDGHSFSGADIAITGDVPIGSGLASSAALEISVIRALDKLNDMDLDPVEMAYIGKRAENDFVGVQSGIMDQFVASLGKHGEALFIDCRNNSYSSIPLFDDYTIVIADTLKKRELASSAYNERKSECQKAVSILKEFYPSVEALRDVNIEMLKDRWEALPKVVAQRAKHVVTENKRVLESVEFLKRGDVEEFCQLMYNSHESLRYDYQVSCL
jgi:galactokinase